MNKKFLMYIILFSAHVKSVNILAEEDRKESPIIIRVIEGKRIVAETAEGKDIETKLMQIRNKLDNEIKGIDQEIEKDVVEWQNKARLKVDSEYLEKRQGEILRKKKERDVKAEAAQEELTKSFNRELSKFNGKIKDTVTEVAQEEGWDIVKIKETGELIYTSKRVDASEQIIRRHDSKYKAQKKATDEAKSKQPVKASEVN